MLKEKAYLLLEDGTFFEGYSVGKKGTTDGEICFNTGMTGYQEVYTDPSYFGQIVTTTNAHIGNYGVLPTEEESDKVQIKGLVIKQFSWTYSRKTADRSLQEYLEDANIVGIAGIDTRMLVRHLREKGAMNAIISSELSDLTELKAKLATTPSMDGLELASKVSTDKPYYVGDPNSSIKVAVLDVGIKKSILTNLTSRDCYCKVFPAKTSFDDMKSWNPDGYFLSNGPGDPATMDYAVDTVIKILTENKPVFGICLGHQLLARSQGLVTYKMHHGHRGLNHPVKNILNGRCEITSQNHGFAVDQSSVEESENVIVSHINLNDSTVEGIKLKNQDAFSVQYHPEASPGPHDSHYLFEDFVELMKVK